MRIKPGDTVFVENCNFPSPAREFYIGKTGTVWSKASQGRTFFVIFDKGAGSFLPEHLRLIKAVTLQAITQPETVPASVTIGYCVICGKPLDGKRPHAKTDSAACRKALSRQGSEAGHE